MSPFSSIIQHWNIDPLYKEVITTMIMTKMFMILTKICQKRRTNVY